MTAQYVVGSLRRLNLMAAAIEAQITPDMKAAELSRLVRTSMAIREKIIREGTKALDGDVFGTLGKGSRKVVET